MGDGNRLAVRVAIAVGDVLHQDDDTYRDVAILFTDIKGFTPYIERYGLEAIERLLTVWETLTTQAAKAQGGQLRGVIGDELFFTFGDVADAVETFVQLRRGWDETIAGKLEGGREVSFCAGLHLGDLHQLRGHVFGNDANRAYSCLELASKLAGGELWEAGQTQQLVATGVARAALAEGPFGECWDERPPVDVGRTVGVVKPRQFTG